MSKFSLFSDEISHGSVIEFERSVMNTKGLSDVITPTGANVCPHGRGKYSSEDDVCDDCDRRCLR